MPSGGEVAPTAIKEAKKAGATVMLALALVVALIVLAWERWNGESKATALLDRWTVDQQRAYAAEIERRLRLVEDNSARTFAALEGIRREQDRQGAALDRLLERMVPGPK